MDRREFLKSTVATAALGATGTLAAPYVARADSGPIKVGLLAPLTGVVAAGGREMVDGFNMYWEQVGNAVGSRKVEVLVEDDASNPDTALQKARRLVEQGQGPFPDWQSARQTPAWQSRTTSRAPAHPISFRSSPPTTLLSASASKKRNPGGRLHRQPDLAAARPIGR